MCMQSTLHVHAMVFARACKERCNCTEMYMHMYTSVHAHVHYCTCTCTLLYTPTTKQRRAERNAPSGAVCIPVT